MFILNGSNIHIAMEARRFQQSCAIGQGTVRDQRRSERQLIGDGQKAYLEAVKS
jgi:hypothetical protein